MYYLRVYLHITFCKYLLKTYYVSGMGDIADYKMDKNSCPLGADI